MFPPLPFLCIRRNIGPLNAYIVNRDVKIKAEKDTHTHNNGGRGRGLATNLTAPWYKVQYYEKREGYSVQDSHEKPKSH